MGKIQILELPPFQFICKQSTGISVGMTGRGMHWTKVKYLYIQWGKKIFDALLILYVCPLTKKWSVYNFNSRFILTVRDRITKTKQKNPEKRISKSYKLICILMSEISIWPLRKTWLSTWWQNSCCQSQRSDVSCSWPPGLHTSQEGFCPTSLCRSSPSH